MKRMVRDEMLNTVDKSAGSWPQDGLEAVGYCPACGSEDRTTLYEGLTDRVFFCAPGQWTMHQCLACRSAYLDPRPTSETIHLAYKEYYTHQGPKRKSSRDLRLLRRFIRSAANGYRNQHFGGNLRPTSWLGGHMIRIIPRFRHRLDRELRYLPKVWPGARLLDVGFGDAAFLELASRIGWTVTGIDADPVAVDNARKRGLDVQQGGIESLTNFSESFDVITLSHVIEHVHHPQQTLGHVFRLLKPGGLLYLDTPNVEATTHRRFQHHWRGLEIPRHLVIFSWMALEEILSKAGFANLDLQLKEAGYLKLASASRAIRKGRNPYRDGKILIRDRINAYLVYLGIKLRIRPTEFLTVVAYRPK